MSFESIKSFEQECKEKDAEIERLNDVIANKDEYIKDKKAECEQLKAALDAIDDHGRALSFIETLKEQKAEIERLKEQLEAQEIRVAALRQNRAEDNQLIAELADALNFRTYPMQDSTLRREHMGLIHRAREASK